MKLRGLIALAMGACFLVFAGSASATQTYTDPQGDQQGTAPDVVQVVVTNDAQGQIGFAISVPNHPTLATDSEIFILIDSDRNGATGAPDSLGTDYFLYMDGSDRTFGLGRWNGSQFDFTVPSNTVEVAFNNGVATVLVNRSELGNTTGFNFWVRGVQNTGPDTQNIDDAPNDGVYAYVLETAAPVRLGSVVLVVGQPRAGRKWTIKVRFVRVVGTNQLYPPDRVRCRATLAGRALRGRSAGGCTFTIPRTARGRQIVVRITVTLAGVSRTYTQRFTVV